MEDLQNLKGEAEETLVGGEIVMEAEVVAMEEVVIVVIQEEEGLDQGRDLQGGEGPEPGHLVIHAAGPGVPALAGMRDHPGANQDRDLMTGMELMCLTELSTTMTFSFSGFLA